MTYRKNQHKQFAIAGPPPDRVNGHHVVDFSFLQGALHRGLQQLSPEERRIIHLHLSEGMGRKQLARELGLSEKSVRLKLEKGWNMLQKFLHGYRGIWLAVPLLMSG